MSKYEIYLRDNPYRIDIVTGKGKNTMVDLEEDEFEKILRDHDHELTFTFTDNNPYGTNVTYREFIVTMDDNTIAMMLLKHK